MHQEHKQGFGIAGIVLIIAAVAVLAGGGYWVYRYLKMEYRSDEGLFKNRPTVAEGLSSTEAIDTSTWKTYRNEKYGFEVRYPSDLVLGEPQGPDTSGFDFGIYIANVRTPFGNFCGEEPDKCQHNYEIDVLLRRSQAKTVDDALRDFDSLPDNRTEVVINGQRFVQVEMDGLTYMTFHNGNEYEIGLTSGEDILPEAKDLFSTILSTFKFIPLEK